MSNMLQHRVGGARADSDAVTKLLVRSLLSSKRDETPAAIRHWIQVKPCYRTPKSAQACSICGLRAKHMHMPIGRVGYFCERCCPACDRDR
jgi:hypothetical protein